MNTEMKRALENDRLIDITTTGRKSGKAHRIEIGFHNLAGRIYITGMPGRPRDWYANMLAKPEITFHLKESVQADLAAEVSPVTDTAERHRILSQIVPKFGDIPNVPDIDAFVAGSPLVEVAFAD